MQGSLWRQRVGQRQARAAHRRPGLRLPARLVARWPPGRLRLLPGRRGRAPPARSRHRRVAAARRERRGEPRAPRWSPDGRRIAFISSAYEGRWHVFIADVTADGRAERIARITEDRDSGLPRYYYSTLDQYLSPTWSPDGARAAARSPTAATSGARAASGGCRRASRRRRRARSATRRRPGRRGPTGAATGGGWSTPRTSGGSGTSSG